MIHTPWTLHGSYTSTYSVSTQSQELLEFNSPLYLSDFLLKMCWEMHDRVFFIVPLYPRIFSMNCVIFYPGQSHPKDLLFFGLNWNFPSGLNGFRYQRFHTGDLVIVVVVDPLTLFTFKNPG